MMIILSMLKVADIYIYRSGRNNIRFVGYKRNVAPRYAR